ncbi:MAG TPA: tetratricopeptide repeat protein [Hyalangium sp.]|nr:tetratricopeptide repeat protein [Hyalangium sp.]
MDVRCERCKTQYDLDDSRISETGVTVQCTTCHHVFVVKKKALVVTVPVKPGQEPQAPTVPLAGTQPAVPTGPPPGLRPMSPPVSTQPPMATAPSPEPLAQPLLPAAAAAGAREWRLRQPSGNTFTFKDLTTLQKWIVERKVSRDDEISLSGETWKRLGDIAELATFFQVVDEAQKAAVLQAQLGMASGAAPRTGPQGTVPPAAPSAQPSAERKGSRLAVLLVLLLVLLGGGAAGYYYLVVMPRPEDEALRAEAARLEAERREQERQEQLRATQTGAGAQLQMDAGSTAGPSQDGGALAAVPEAGDGGAMEDAGADAGMALDAGAEDAGLPPDAGSAVPDAGTAGVKRPAPVRDFDYYMTQGNRLRERERSEAALEAYAEAAELEPDRAEPYSGRGMAYLDLGDPRQAETEFKQALKINANYGEAIIGLAETYRSQGKKAEAIRYYERYLEVLPNGPEASVARSAIERLKE